MYTAHIGKCFLELYNEKNRSDLSAEGFFDQVMFPLFFDHDKSLMTVHNSPFDQIYKQKKYDKAEERIKAKLSLKEKITKGEIGSNTAVGFASQDVVATTSGQVSSIAYGFSKEDVYASWIGAGFGLVVQGGYVLFLENEEVLWLIFEGWDKYRELLNQSPSLKANQIDSWNSQWVINKSSGSSTFSPITSESKGVQRLETLNWVKVVFALNKLVISRHAAAFVCQYGQTNTSIGFIQLVLSEIRHLWEMRDQVSGLADLPPEVFVKLYETEKGFEQACRQGSIGLRAIKPKNLDIEKPANLNKLSVGDKDTLYQYNIYLLWIAVMLNNPELLKLAESAAETLASLQQNEKSKVGTKSKNQINELLASYSRRKFVDQLATLLEDSAPSGDTKSVFDEVVKAINALSIEQFRYFVTLVRYQYVILN